VAASRHSVRAAASPRRRNRLMPRVHLMVPKTGSMVGSPLGVDGGPGLGGEFAFHDLGRGGTPGDGSPGGDRAATGIGGESDERLGPGRPLVGIGRVGWVTGCVVVGPVAVVGHRPAGRVQPDRGQVLAGLVQHRAELVVVGLVVGDIGAHDESVAIHHRLGVVAREVAPRPLDHPALGVGDVHLGWLLASPGRGPGRVLGLLGGQFGQRLLQPGPPRPMNRPGSDGDSGYWFPTPVGSGTLPVGRTGGYDA
jgi:hypothetical protein